MQVFISWSGSKSKEMSIILNNWLPQIFPHVDFFISSDIEKGANFLEVILKALKESSVGIFLLTKANTSAPWIQFEAGAFASKGVESKICPLYIDDDIEVEETGPLRFFQGSLINEKDMYKLISSINTSLETPIANERILRLFEANKREFFHNWDLIKNMQPATGIFRTTNKEFLANIARDLARLKISSQQTSENTNSLISTIEEIHKVNIPRAIQKIEMHMKPNIAAPGVTGIPKFDSRTGGGDFSSTEAYEIAIGTREFGYKTLTN